VIFAEILHEAGVPPGVFNLVNGDGLNAGMPLCEHPAVDMISFTGSTRAGIEVAKAAAGTIKRVGQELGGKSANIIFEDADVLDIVRSGTSSVFTNSGQTCGAATRILVPRARAQEAYAVAAEAASAVRIGDPADPQTQIGPVANARQFAHVQRLIKAGIDSGARLVAGGPGKPEGINAGYFVRPTIFGEVDPDSAVAQEEVFGPVVAIIPFDSEEHAIEIANNSAYGLVAQVHTRDAERVKRVVPQLRTGQVLVNNPGWDVNAPFGGYKRSGNGREGGPVGFEEYLETKALLGVA
jgi:aldehyde dehydrogenase (NAD+)